MATTTQNLGLIEPAGTDHALVSNINTNSDKIDAEAGNVRGNFALVQNGDTATQAISKGELVVWKGVLKKASANIANGATLSGSNLSDDTIAAELAALNNKIENKTDSISINQSYTAYANTVCRTGNVCEVSLTLRNTNIPIDTPTTVGSIPLGFRPKYQGNYPLLGGSGNGKITVVGNLAIKADGDIVVYMAQEKTYIEAYPSYICE